MAGIQKWLLPAVTGVAGLTAGLLIGAHRADSPAAVFMPGPAESHSGLTAEDVRRVVREELAAKGTGSAGSTPAAQPSLPPATAQQVAAASEAQSVLEGAIAKRSWTEQDADAMRDVFPNLSGDQQAEFLRQYSVAVNQGRLTPQTERVPF
jgi:hypothetical protein